MNMYTASGGINSLTANLKVLHSPEETATSSSGAQTTRLFLPFKCVWPVIQATEQMYSALKSSGGP